MKRALVLLCVGILLTMLQGAVATFVPPALVPDLGLLLVFGIALCWRSSAGGLVVSAALGYVADLLSGTLLGEHALMRVLAFAAARLGARHLNLRGALPQVAFVAALTAAHALLLGTLTSFMAGGVGPSSIGIWELIGHAAMNALFAPLVAAFTGLLLGRLGDDDGGRRLLSLEPRSWSS